MSKPRPGWHNSISASHPLIAKAAALVEASDKPLRRCDIQAATGGAPKACATALVMAARQGLIGGSLRIGLRTFWYSREAFEPAREKKVATEKEAKRQANAQRQERWARSGRSVPLDEFDDSPDPVPVRRVFVPVGVAIPPPPAQARRWVFDAGVVA